MSAQTMREHGAKSKSAGLWVTGLLAAAWLSACTTVPVDPAPRPAPRTGPVIVQPDPDVTEIPDEEDVVEAPNDADVEIEVPDSAQPYFNNREGLTLPHMAGRDTKRLALLLPFSARSERLREEAASMFQAAEMALFQRDTADVVLIALDTKGTDAGARSAAQAALTQGADVILGPITAGNVQAAAREAQRSGTPLLAFSNDQRVAGAGTYLLSFPPEAEVERVVGEAASQGVTRFAFFGPDDAYGRRVRAAYEQAVARSGGQVTATETYVGNDISVMQEPAQRLANAYRDAEVMNRSSGGMSPRLFEAILLPEGGTALRSLAPLMPFYGVDPDDVLFMGTSRWDDPTTSREPALDGGIFAAADKDARADFLVEFERIYGTKPSALASLAHDAVSFGTYIADGDPRQKTSRAEAFDGFYGTDGFVRFGPGGRPERGLAVYTIRGGAFRLVDPAPRGPSPES